MTGTPCVVELRDDGTFTATNLPPQSSDPDDEKFFSKLVSGSGTWKVANAGSIAYSGLTTWGIHFSCETAEIEQAQLTGSAPPYGLIFTIGDPDRGRCLFLEREKPMHTGTDTRLENVLPEHTP